MKKEELLEKLAAEFPLIVRTPYHVQIETANGPHNIWLSKRGLRFQACGQPNARWVTSGELFIDLGTYDYSKTDLAFMQSLTKFIGEITGKEGIFVDAGWKNGKAKAAIIRSQATGDMDIVVRLIESENSYHAELWAIGFALTHWECSDIIHSDCKTAVMAAANPRVIWIPRGQNKQADSIGNMRGA